MASFTNNDRIENIVKTYAELLMRELNISSVYLYGS